MSEEIPTVSGVIAAGIRIGNGDYREVYRQGNTAGKIVKPQWKTLVGKLLLKVKFGTDDINALEKFNYEHYVAQIPVRIRDYFISVTGRSFSKSGDLITCELAANSDGTPAKRIKDYGLGGISDRMFWDRMGILEKVLIDWEIPFFGINAENVLVREWKELNVGCDKYPIVVDLKRFGYRTTVFQPQVKLKKGFEAKIHRAFDRLRQEYNVA
jgi:hypothetical protein